MQNKQRSESEWKTQRGEAKRGYGEKHSVSWMQ